MHQNGLIQSANTLADGVVLATAYGQDDSELYLKTNGNFYITYTKGGRLRFAKSEYNKTNSSYSVSWQPDNGTGSRIRGEFTTLTTNSAKFTRLLFTRQNHITEINASNGALYELKLSGCSDLKTLSCQANQLKTLDVARNTALVTLYCGTNKLATLDVSNNTAIKTLYCQANQITTLEVTTNTALKDLRCGTNKITTLDVSNNTALSALYCQENQLATLDVANNTALKDLRCNSNKITTLDVANNTALVTLYCQANQLATLDVANNTALKDLQCGANKLTTIDVSNNAALMKLQCEKSELLTSLNVSNTPSVTKFNFSGTLDNIGAANTSATIYSALNAAFATFADAGTLTTDNTEASATLRATAEAKGWTVTIVE